MKKIKIFTIILLFLLLVFNLEVVQAEVNRYYGAVSSVSNVEVSSAVAESSLLGLLARLVYAIGTMIEWLTSIIFQSLTGTNDFPWADKIVFNAVPMLDVNYINPARGSFVGNTDISRVIKNMYSTILALASGFFGIIVMITSIKLVISTIAEEKAKYKKAITDWLIGFIMLFCIHYLLSFLFYLNETLVTVASQIAVAQYEGAEEKLKAQNSQFAQQIIDNMGEDKLYSVPPGSKYYGKPIKDILRENTPMLEKWTSLPSGDTTYGLHEFLMKSTVADEDYLLPEPIQRQRIGLVFAWALDNNISVSELQEIAQNKVIAVLFDVDWQTKEWTGEVVNEEELMKVYGDYWPYFKDVMYGQTEKTDNAEYNKLKEEYGTVDNVGTGTLVGNTMHASTYLPVKSRLTFQANRRSTEEYFNSLPSDVVFYASRGMAGIVVSEEIDDDWDIDNNPWQSSYAHHTVLDELATLKSYSETANYGTNDNIKTGNNINFVITDLAGYFKTNAYERVMNDKDKITGASKTENVYPQNMIMFAILVVQSIILFIAYVKRLFYVLLLGLMAPVVVIFDFFQRFGK